MYKKTILAVAVLIAIGIFVVISFRSQSTSKRTRSYANNAPVKRVLILGNSIVRHGPLPEIGWNNNWGMAASSIDSDFVHILFRNIKAKDSTCQVMYENIADFESGYQKWDYNKADTFTRFQPDIIVMRIAENVNDHLAEDNDFIDYYDKLINRIDTGAHAMVFICNGWWANKHVNVLIQEYANKHGYPFIDQTRLYDSSTIALGEYENKDVAQHPNNQGMRKIAESIWDVIKIYFK